MKIDMLLAELEQHRSEHEIWPRASHADVAQTEADIGILLPESYRQFVTQFSNGAYLFFVQEVCSVGNSNRRISSIQQVFHRDWMRNRSLTRMELETNLPFREGGTIKRKYLVPFSLDSNGNEWCFLVEEWIPREEYPVAYLDNRHLKLYGRLEGFASWLNVVCKSKKEVIRTLYDDDVLEGELGLG